MSSEPRLPCCLGLAWQAAATTPRRAAQFAASAARPRPACWKLAQASGLGHASWWTSCCSVEPDLDLTGQFGIRIARHLRRPFRPPDDVRAERSGRSGKRPDDPDRCGRKRPSLVKVETGETGWRRPNGEFSRRRWSWSS